MILQLSFVLSAISFFASYGNCKEVICYVLTSGPDITSQIDTSLCTIFNIAFGTADVQGNVQLPSNFASFKKLKTPTSKLILSFGGDGVSASTFKAIAASPAARRNFSQNCLTLVRNNALDGIDISWTSRFPENADRENFVALHQDLKSKLAAPYLVTTAVSGLQLYVSMGYDIAALSRVVDYFNIMAYDLHTDEEQSTTGCNAPPFPSPFSPSSDTVSNAITIYLRGGAPASKLILGVPFYGRQYELANPNNNGIGALIISGHQASDPSYVPPYNKYCLGLNSGFWNMRFDDTQKCSYGFNGNLWLSFEDIRGINIRGNLANQHNLGGLMAWSLNQDDYNGVCSNGKWPLLKVLSSVLENDTVG